jgi:hypothetical protein
MSISREDISVLISAVRYAVEEVGGSIYTIVRDESGRCLFEYNTGWQSADNVIVTSTPTPENPTKKDG